MPNLATRTVPGLCKHKATGQAVVRLNGKDHYLGRFGTAASRAAYDRLICEWLANGRQLPTRAGGPTVNEVILAFWQHAEKHYRKPDGSQTSEIDCLRLALRPLRRLFGTTPANSFGPAQLRIVREEMIRLGWVRRSINTHVCRLRGVFRWATENGQVDPSIYHGLLAVRGLQAGRSDAKESAPVRPVPEARIHAVLPLVGSSIRAMIELQMLTAMRPGEVCVMRACDIEMAGSVWIYRPQAHKTQHHGLAREIYLGPRAQAIVRPFLQMGLRAYLFNPLRAMEMRQSELRRQRAAQMRVLGREGATFRSNRRLRDHYDPCAYRHAIQRACDRAFPPVSGLNKEALKAWRRANRWHPHQLRHNAATRLRREFGVELARIVLGHETAFTTEIYAEVDRQQAMEAMSKVG